MLYLQVEEHITLPKTLLKAVFVNYLAFFGILNIDESKIIQNSTCAALYCWYWKDAFIVEIKSLNIRIAIGLFAQVCAIK